jgi:hypothetical protein
LSFNAKCNLFDTIPGTYLLSYTAYRLEELSFLFTPISIFLRVIDSLGLLMDMADFGFGLNTFFVHRDPYNRGFFAGKTVKLITQAYMRMRWSFSNRDAAVSTQSLDVVEGSEGEIGQA